MLRITREQMQSLDQQAMAQLKRRIANGLKIKYPQQFNLLHTDKLDFFLRESIVAAQAVWMETDDQITRFVSAFFHLQLVASDVHATRMFTATMLTEESTEARLTFVEKNLISNL